MELFSWRTKGARAEVGVEEEGVKARLHPLTLCLLQTDQQAEARSYLSEEMIAGEWGRAGCLSVCLSG